MSIVRHRQAVRVEQYTLSFEWNDLPGAGFGFPCDRQGVLLLDEMPSIAQENLQKCLNGEYDVIPRGVKDYSYTYWEPALLRCCNCERMVELIGFTNTCDCGFEYNSFGQLLAPRNQWEEDI